MFFRVRASLHERPGALADLAARCGEAGLNILGLQIFPDLGRVTDELVVSVPEEWTAGAVAELVSGAGGDEVSVEPCTTHDLIDQPVRWLSAAQDALADPDLLPVLLEKLLGPHPEKWSATEHSRAEALRSLVDSLGSARGETPADSTHSHPVEYDETGSGVLARIGGHVVGAAAFTGTSTGGANTEDPSAEDLSVEVSPSWRRLGIGTGLLTRALAKATARGLDEVVLVAPTADQGFVTWLLQAGTRARMKAADGVVVARITTTGRMPTHDPGSTARVR
jgi:ribosomal protein S18 acetylase RimI-like enzyme